MTKRNVLLLSAGVIACMASSGAHAEGTDTATIQLSGKVEDICTLTVTGVGTTVGVSSVSEVTIDDGRTVNFDFDIANTDTAEGVDIGEVAAGSIPVGYNVYCNDDGVTLSVTALGSASTPNALDNGDHTAAAPFIDELALNDISIDLPDGTNETLGNGVSATIGEQKGTGDITVSWGATSNLISGLYEGTITVDFATDGTYDGTSF